MRRIRRAGFGADPQVLALVQAAASDDTEEIDRLLADGVDIDAEAPIPLPGGQPMASLGQLFPGGPPAIAMTPLLAAVVYKRRLAAERLLDGEADPNRVHPLFGTPVHAAAGAGDIELLQLLIDHGGDVSLRNAQGQTPLQVVAAGRGTQDRLAQAQSMMKSMGIKIPGLVEQLSKMCPPQSDPQPSSLFLHRIALNPRAKPRPNHQRALQVMRAMTPRQKLAQVFKLNERTLKLFRIGLRRRFPDLDDAAFERLYLQMRERCRNRTY